MHITEAKIILKCRRPIKAGKVWLKMNRFGFTYSKNYIYTKLSDLAMMKLLIRREINNGGKAGRTVFYTATPRAIVEAMNTIECYIRDRAERRSGGVIANLNSYFTTADEISSVSEG